LSFAKNALIYDVPSKAFAEQLTLRWLKHCQELVMAALWRWIVWPMSVGKCENLESAQSSE
jgi:hypothetical protein